MNEALSKLIYPVFQHVIDLQDRALEGNHPALPPEREKILVLIRDAEERAQASGSAAGDFPLVKRLLAYWVDEALVNSAWRYAKDWEANTLEWEYYQEKIRAERFFEAANEALDRDGSDPLEVAILAVSLGFRGDYRFDVPALRRESQRYLKRYLKTVSALAPPAKGPPGRPLEPLPGPYILLGVCALVSVTAVVTLLSFILTHSPSQYHL